VAAKPRCQATSGALGWSSAAIAAHVGALWVACARTPCTSHSRATPQKQQFADPWPMWKLDRKNTPRGFALVHVDRSWPSHWRWPISPFMWQTPQPLLAPRAWLLSSSWASMAVPPASGTCRHAPLKVVTFSGEHSGDTHKTPDVRTLVTCKCQRLHVSMPPGPAVKPAVEITSIKQCSFLWPPYDLVLVLCQLLGHRQLCRQWHCVLLCGRVSCQFLRQVWKGCTQ
jgi:hypothetical protein